MHVWRKISQSLRVRLVEFEFKFVVKLDEACFLSGCLDLFMNL